MFDLIFDYLSVLGLIGLFVAVFIEAMGVPFPGGIMIIITGILVNQGRLGFYDALAAIVSGFTAGSIFAYFIGRSVGQPFLNIITRRLPVTPERLEQARGWLDTSAPAFLVLGRFLPGVSNLTPYMAGMSRIGLACFVFYNSIFVTGWGLLYLLVGMFFGHNYELITGYLNARLPLAGLLLIGLYLVWQYMRKLLRRRANNV